MSESGSGNGFFGNLKASAAVRYALALSLLWIGGIFAYAWGYFSTLEAGAPLVLTLLLFAFALVLPLVLFWLAASLFDRLDRMHVDAARIAGSMAVLEEKLSLHGPTSLNELEHAVTLAAVATAERERTHWRASFDAIDERFNKMGTMLGELLDASEADNETLRALIREAVAETRPPAMLEPGDYVPATGHSSEDHDQASLPLGTPDVATPDTLSWADIALALHFPDSDEDYTGLAARKRTMRNRAAAQVLRASEDLLNLMSQDGIYTDDLRSSVAPAMQWRQYASGSRGPEVADVGGIRDKSALAIIRARMRSDQIFRDTALHFQRKFDGLLQDFANSASDRDILNLADSRTGRAFMLCARVNGTFD